MPGRVTVTALPRSTGDAAANMKPGRTSPQLIRAGSEEPPEQGYLPNKIRMVQLKRRGAAPLGFSIRGGGLLQTPSFFLSYTFSPCFSFLFLLTPRESTARSPDANEVTRLMRTSCDGGKPVGNASLHGNSAMQCKLAASADTSCFQLSREGDPLEGKKNEMVGGRYSVMEHASRSLLLPPGTADHLD